MFSGYFSNLNPFSFKNAERPKAFFEKWSGEANFWLLQGDEKTKRGNDCLVLFESQSNWEYSLVVDVGQNIANSDGNKYCFPVSSKMNIKQDINEQNNSVIFELDLNATNKIQLEFETTKDDYSLANKFLYIITRLMYQTDNQKGYEGANERDFQEYWSFKKEKKPEISTAVQEIMEKLSKDKSISFCAAGELSMYNPKDPQSSLRIINPQWVLTIKGTEDKHTSVLDVCTENGNSVLNQVIDTTLQYYVDENQNLLTWLGTNIKSENNEQIAFNFKMITDNASVTLKMVILVCLCQNQEKMAFDQIVQKEAKKDWQEYYMNNDETVNSGNLGDDYNNYNQRGKMNLEFSNDLHYGDNLAKVEESTLKSEITGMTQAHVLNRAFINKGNILEAWKVDNSGDQKTLEHIVNLPELKTLKGEKLNPSNLFLQEDDSRIIMNEGSQVFYYDIEKGTVVQQMGSTVDENKNIEDICSYEKKQDGVRKEFFGVTNKEIIHFDPRQENGVAQNRHYKTAYDFNKIMSSKDGNVAVGSKAGDVRMIKKVGDRNAKNVLPSMLGDSVNGIDTSKDGKWLLTTCDSYLLLFPTQQGGQDGFNKTFLKAEKPTPKVLRVHPTALVKHGIKDLKFLSARFDVKKGEVENYIVASSGPFMMIWQMKNILKGNYVTKEVKQLTSNIISNEFLRETDALIAAFKKGLVIQDTQEIKKHA